MGYDISFVTIISENGMYAISKVLATDELSYNFNSWQEDEHNWKKDFYFRDHMAGKHASVAIKNLKSVLQKMSRAGIKVGIPDNYNSSWYWGCSPFPTLSDPFKTVRLPYEQFAGVYRYHLERFLKILLRYPTCYVKSDSIDSVLMEDGKVVDILDIKWNVKPENDDLLVYVNHPIKGSNVKIDSADKAMKIYDTLKSQGKEVEANLWFKQICKLSN